MISRICSSDGKGFVAKGEGGWLFHTGEVLGWWSRMSI